MDLVWCPHCDTALVVPDECPPNVKCIQCRGVFALPPELVSDVSAFKFRHPLLLALRAANHQRLDEFFLATRDNVNTGGRVFWGMLLLGVGAALAIFMIAIGLNPRGNDTAAIYAIVVFACCFILGIVLRIRIVYRWTISTIVFRILVFILCFMTVSIFIILARMAIH